MTGNALQNNPEAIASAGQRIYQERYRSSYERDYPGRFLAIDVISGEAYMAEQPEEAIRKAQEAKPQGIFHLIRIGSAGAFRMSYVSNAHRNWLSR